MSTPTDNNTSASGLELAGVIAAFLVPPVGLILGLYGRQQARRLGRPTTLSTIAAIVGGVLTGIGLVFLVIGLVILGSAVAGSQSAGPGQGGNAESEFCAAVTANASLISSVVALQNEPERDNPASYLEYAAKMDEVVALIDQLEPIVPDDEFVVVSVQVARSEALRVSNLWGSYNPASGIAPIDTLAGVQNNLIYIQDYCA